LFLQASFLGFGVRGWRLEVGGWRLEPRARARSRGRGRGRG
jgi:hypothetical protein